jgi:hypothetical protein
MIMNSDGSRLMMCITFRYIQLYDVAHTHTLFNFCVCLTDNRKGGKCSVPKEMSAGGYVVTLMSMIADIAFVSIVLPSAVIYRWNKIILSEYSKPASRRIDIVTT